LPEEINEAISFHHNPQEAGVSTDLVSIVGLSNGLASAWGIGAEVPGEDEEAIIRNSALNITADELAEIRMAAVGEFNQLVDSMT
jgi:hypothetical protein